MVNGIETSFEVDTGATKSIIIQNTYELLWPSSQAPIIHATDVRLRTYTGEPIEIRGEIRVEVTLSNQQHEVKLLVVAGNGPSLLGRDWLDVLKLKWSNTHQLRCSADIEAILSDHAVLFSDELGCIKGVHAKIHVDASVSPKYHRARSIPYALWGKVDAELERLQEKGVIEPVRFSEWAAPVVPVMKGDGSIRICGDYKVTVN